MNFLRKFFCFLFCHFWQNLTKIQEQILLANFFFPAYFEVFGRIGRLVTLLWGLQTWNKPWRACNLTASTAQFHWSSGPPVCFLSWRTWVQSPGGYLSETWILLLALSRYIGDPNVIDNCGLVWGGLRLEPSLGNRTDNVIILLDLTQLFYPGFMLAAGPPGALWRAWRACNLTASTTQFHYSSGPPVCFLSLGTPVQSPGGYLCETWILL